MGAAQVPRKTITHGKDVPKGEGSTTGYHYDSPQAFSQARGLADDNLAVAGFREGPDIADERKAENEAARSVANGDSGPFPEALVTPHGI